MGIIELTFLQTEHGHVCGCGTRIRFDDALVKQCPKCRQTYQVVRQKEVKALKA